MVYGNQQSSLGMLTAGALTVPMCKGVRGHSSYQNPEGDGIYMDRAARQDL